jgi:MOSC domain-containing protein YiiM
MTRALAPPTLPRGARLHPGDEAIAERAGLRHRCARLNRIEPGPMAATVIRDAHGPPVRKAGIMAIVPRDGGVKPGDPIRAALPPPSHHPLEPV